MRSILITGASGGIGRALALACARSGLFSRIILNGGSDREALHETARLVSGTGDVLCLSSLGDVGNPDYVLELRRAFGPVDTLVNNAGVSWVGLLTDMSPESWNRLMSVNLTALYNTCHTYVPDMVRMGGGCILNVSSVWGRVGASCEVAYSASKGAVDAFTRSLAKELAPSRISVNAIAPGLVDTRMNAHLSEEDRAALDAEIPAGRAASPEETAEAMLRLLCMPDYFTGNVVRFDGAWE